MPTRNVPKDLEAIFLGIENESDRAAIVVAASLVEYALELAIASRLREPTNKEEERKLFADNGIMRTFSQKIWWAYFLKVVGPRARRELDLIREIRNRAAHNMNPVSFRETEEIFSRCETLAFAATSVSSGRASSDPRRRFLDVALFFAANLIMRSGDRSAEISHAFNQLAPDLNR